MVIEQNDLIMKALWFDMLTEAKMTSVNLSLNLQKVQQENATLRAAAAQAETPSALGVELSDGVPPAPLRRGPLASPRPAG